MVNGKNTNRYRGFSKPSTGFRLNLFGDFLNFSYFSAVLKVKIDFFGCDNFRAYCWVEDHLNINTKLPTIFHINFDTKQI